MPSQTTSLATSKLLKEAGFPQDRSHFCWREPMEARMDRPTDHKDLCYRRDFIKDGDIAAPTTDELLAELPKRVKGQPILIGFDETIWWVTYQKSDRILQESMDLREALAKCYIYLNKGPVK